MSRSATREATAITAEELRFLRKCKVISFAHHDGRTIIRGRISEKNDASMLEVEIGFRFAQYGDDPIDEPAENASCHELDLWANHHDSRVNTILRVVRPGDRITAIWVRDNDNGYIEKSGPRLHRDELQLDVRRPGGRRPVQFNFLVSVSICEDNTARMTRRRSQSGW